MDGSGIASDKWFDKSGIDLHGVVTNGATVENAPSGDTGLIHKTGTYAYTMVGSSSGNWTIRSGYEYLAYTRIGNMCHIQGKLETTSDSAGSGELRISLPFTSATLPDTSDWMLMGLKLYNVTGASGLDNMVAVISPDNAHMTAYKISASGVDAEISNGDFSNNVIEGYIGGTYIVKE